MALLKQLLSPTRIYRLVQQAQRGCKARLVTLDEVAYARKLFVAFSRYCRENGLADPVLEMTGGAVANAYAYGATTTFLRISETLEHDERRFEVTTLRVRAQHQPYGSGIAIRLIATMSAGIVKKTIPPLIYGEESFRMRQSKKLLYFYKG